MPVDAAAAVAAAAAAVAAAVVAAAVAAVAVDFATGAAAVAPAIAAAVAAAMPVADDDCDCDCDCDYDSAAFSECPIVACKDHVPAGSEPARSSFAEVHSADFCSSSRGRAAAAAVCYGSSERNRDSSKFAASASDARPSQNRRTRFTNQLDGK